MIKVITSISEKGGVMKIHALTEESTEATSAEIIFRMILEERLGDCLTETVKLFTDLNSMGEIKVIR